MISEKPLKCFTPLAWYFFKTIKASSEIIAGEIMFRSQHLLLRGTTGTQVTSVTGNVGVSAEGLPRGLIEPSE